MKSVSANLRRLTAISILSLAVGCTDRRENSATTATSPASPKIEEHSHGTGPHGGTVADWGGGAYHVEFAVDHGKREATVYILGSDAKTPEPINARQIQLIINDPATEIELNPQPLEGEAAGTSSRFVGTHDNIGVVQEFDGTISGEVKGTPYFGEFEEQP